MTNKDLIKQYANTGAILTDYQIGKLNNNLVNTYIRRRLLQSEQGDSRYEFRDYEVKYLDNDAFKKYLEFVDLYLPKGAWNILTEEQETIYWMELIDKKMFLVSINDVDKFSPNLQDYFWESAVKNDRSIYLKDEHFEKLSRKTILSYFKFKVDTDSLFWSEYIPKELEDIVLKYAIDKGVVSYYDIDKLSPKLQLHYWDNEFKYKEEIDYYRIPKELLNRCYELRIEYGHDLGLIDVEDMPEDLQLKYWEREMSNYSNKYVPSDIITNHPNREVVKGYLKRKIENDVKSVIESEIEEVAPELLNLYYDKYIDSGERIWSSMMDKFTPKQKLKVISNKLDAGEWVDVSEEEFNKLPLKLKRKAIDNDIKDGLWIDDYMFDVATNTQKLRFFKNQLSSGEDILRYRIPSEGDKLYNQYMKLVDKYSDK